MNVRDDYKGYQTTYKELKHSIGNMFEEGLGLRYQTTYKELKHLSEKEAGRKTISYQTTYKELKLCSLLT